MADEQEPEDELSVSGVMEDSGLAPDCNYKKKTLLNNLCYLPSNFKWIQAQSVILLFYIPYWTLLKHRTHDNQKSK